MGLTLRFSLPTCMYVYVHIYTEMKKAAEEKEKLQKENAELLARAEKAEKDLKEKEESSKKAW